MNIPHVLAQVIRRSPSLARILDATVEIVAREMGADVCSIYLLEPSDHRLRLAATQGLNPDARGKVTLALGEGITGIVVKEMRAISEENAAAHPSYRYFPETGEEQFTSYLGVPLAIRNRPVGAIVVQSRDARTFTKEETETLHTIAAQLVGVVENARLVKALDQPEQSRHYLNELRTWNREEEEEQKKPSGNDGQLRFKGNPASSGIAIGKAIYRGAYEVRLGEYGDSSVNPARERARLTVALEKAGGDILRIQEAAEKETDEEHALIFSSHLLLLNDPTLLHRLHAAIDMGRSAQHAVDHVFSDLEAQLGSVRDVYLQERVEDIRDLRNRILSHLLDSGGPITDIADGIVVAHGIPPSLVVELKVEGALGIVTERGGVTSHGALLARAMGIPAVTGVQGLLETVRTGEEAIVDGSTGKVILRPTARTLVKYRRAAEEIAASRTRLDAIRDEPARSLDGETVPLLANVGIAVDIRQALRCGAEGIGLYRTEFPFMIREDFPTREEQVHIYRRACNAFPNGPIRFRLLDLGGDKHHPRITRTDEPNPVLGYRSIRLMLDHPRILKEQVQAFVLVAEEREASILIPMVSSIGELRRTRTLIAEAIDEIDGSSALRPPKIGLMIEVPAAVEIALDLAREADFLSIGTNDLIQFALAVDRENSRVARFGDPFHPAVLRMVSRVIQAGHSAGITVSCCGELAATPELAVLLMAMQIDDLSLTPHAIPSVKAAIRRSNVKAVRKRLGDILELPEAKLIRATLAELVPPGE